MSLLLSRGGLLLFVSYVRPSAFRLRLRAAGLRLWSDRELISLSVYANKRAVPMNASLENERSRSLVESWCGLCSIDESRTVMARLDEKTLMHLLEPKRREG